MSGVPPFGEGPSGDATDPPDEDLLAAELVLGVLDAQARRRADQLTGEDRRFAARVQVWEQRLSPWLTEVPSVAVPDHIWTQLRARLGWQEGVHPRPGLWNSLALWRTATAFALLAVITVWLWQPSGSVRQGEAALTKPVTPLLQGDGATQWLASVDSSSGTVLMVPVPRAADAEGRIAELWVIPSGKAPVSLGAVSTTRAHTVEVPQVDRAALSAPGSVLAITLEPAAGVPHSAPTGPIIAKGSIRI